VSLQAAAVWPRPPDDGDWPAFGRDAGRTGASPLDFASTDLGLLWSFRLSEHTFRCRKETNVWSVSPVGARVGGRALAFVGAYDHKVYGFEAATGERVWRYTTGEEVVAAPLLAPAGAAPLLIAGSTDRCLYGLDPLTGERRWAQETLPWSYTASPAVFGSPLAFELDGEPRCATTFFISDHDRSQRLQEGWLAVWSVQSGRLVWRLLLSKARVHGPAAGTVAGRPVLFVTTSEGVVAAVDARDGQLAWKMTLDEKVYGAPTLAGSADGPVLLVATALGLVWSLDAVTGRPRWSYKTGQACQGSPSVGPAGDGRTAVFVGSNDRHLYALDLATGQALWRFKAGNEIFGKPAIASVAGRPVVFFPSMDDRLYGVDTRTGKQFWSYRFGSLLWPFYARLRDVVFSSPIVVGAGGRPILLFPAHDGVTYAFACGRERTTLEDVKP
jgi:outer membrane protein assembly factor BamB